MSKLREALQKKFRTPAEAIQALGLDSSILEADDVSSSKRPKNIVAHDSKASETRRARARVRHWAPLGYL